LKKLIKKLLPVFFAATLVLPVSLPLEKVKAETKIAATVSVDSIKKKSRQFFTMKDVNGTVYTAYIFANNGLLEC
jgi:hypothetical protein